MPTLNTAEEKFIQSIQTKINDYSIPVSIQQAVSYASGIFYEVEYNTGKTEVVDTGIELFLIKMSFLYFIEQYGWVTIPKVGTVLFDPYYFQKEFAKEVNNYGKVIAEKTRQCGFSTIAGMYALWKANFFPSEFVDVVSMKQQKAQTFVTRFRATYENLPIPFKTKLIKDNTQELMFEHQKGVYSQIISETNSENSGRGDSLSLLILDEVAHYGSEKRPYDIVAAASPALSKSNGQIFLISTSNGTSGKGQYYYQQVYNAKMHDEKNTKLITVEWWEIPDDERIKGPTRGYNDILNKAIQQNYYYDKNVKKQYNNFLVDQVARKDWKKNEYLSFQHEVLGEVLYRQEILHDFIVKGDRVFNEEHLQKYKAIIQEPKTKDTFQNQHIQGYWEWKKPYKKGRYIISADVATGTGSDYSTIQVFDVLEYEQAAEYKGFISTPNFVRLLRNVAAYYNEAYIMMECNSIGEAVFNGLYYAETKPYRNMYSQWKVKNGIKRKTGWITDVKTRELIMNEFIDWITVDEYWDRMTYHSERLYEEMTNLVWNDKGKPQHADGCHDDLIISMGLALYSRNKADKTGESFLIDENGILLQNSHEDYKNDKIEDEDYLGFVFTDSEYEREDERMNKEKMKWLIGQ